MKLILIVFWITFTCILSQTLSIFDTEIQNVVAIIEHLRFDLIAAFDASGHDKPLLATTVRLIFHDCGGPPEIGDPTLVASICNGCISFSNVNNLGLESGAILPLESIYISYQNVMSRADFWAAAATIAIEYAQALDFSNDFLPAIPFYFGRRDCLTSPTGIQNRQFPDAHAGWQETINWFQIFLGMRPRTTVAILGAHTLGKTHERFSGFGTRPWVHRSFVLNNQYYQDIIDLKWSPVEVNCRSRSGCKWEWHTKSGGKTLMLNPDMAIWFGIDRFLNRRTGEVTCDWRTCPLNPSAQDLTKSYARNNQLWLNDFADAFDFLVTSGYNRNQLLSVHVPPSTIVVTDVAGGVNREQRNRGRFNGRF
eukprot:450654_1